MVSTLVAAAVVVVVVALIQNMISKQILPLLVITIMIILQHEIKPQEHPAPATNLHKSNYIIIRVIPRCKIRTKIDMGGS